MAGKLVHVSGFLDFLSPQIQTLVGPSSLIIYQRNIISPRAFDAMQYWQGMGKPVVIDLDDAYQMLPYCNPARPFWFEREFQTPNGDEEPGGAIKMLQEGIRLSDGLVSPNRLLLEDWKHLSGNGYYLQNYAEPDWWTNLPPREELKKERGLEDRIVIGWGGSVSHYDSWWGSGLREAAESVSKRHPELYWLICGNDNRLHDQLKVSARQKGTQGGVPPNLWPRTVASFDIGVAPLFGIYDQRRSWIKGIEYLLGGVPWIGIDGETYGDLKGLGVLGPETPEFWEDALENIIANLEAEQEQAAGRVELARKRFIVDNNIDVYRTVYEQILQDFQDDKATLPGVYEVVKNEKIV